MSRLDNLPIRQIIETSGLTYGAVAKEMCVTRQWLSSMLSKPLSDFNQYRIMKAVNTLRGANALPAEATGGKVKVYFTNGNTAVFPADKVVFRRENPQLPQDGAVIVNWAAVSWMREYQEDA